MRLDFKTQNPLVTLEDRQCYSHWTTIAGMFKYIENFAPNFVPIAHTAGPESLTFRTYSSIKANKDTEMF